MLNFTYKRRKIADDEATYQLEWSVNLDDAWTTSDVVAHPPSDLGATSENIRITAPASPNGKHFLRLKITVP